MSGSEVVPTAAFLGKLRGARLGRGAGGWGMWMGLGMLASLLLVCVAAPVIAPYSPTNGDVANLLAPPSREHWLGTDQLGRDVLSRLLYGGRTDLLIAFGVLVAPLVLGVSLGLLSGLRGGWIDHVIMRVCDAVQAFPLYVLVLAIVFSLGPGITSLFIAFTCVNWVPYARLTRSDTQLQKTHDFILAARAAGFSGMRVAFRHVLPNVLRQPLVYQMSDVIQNILAIVTLGFLGLGVQPPTPDWGAMIAAGQPFITSDALLSIIPGLCVVFTGLCIALIGDGLAAWDDTR